MEHYDGSAACTLPFWGLSGLHVSLAAWHEMHVLPDVVALQPLRENVSAALQMKQLFWSQEYTKNIFLSIML